MIFIQLNKNPHPGNEHERDVAEEVRVLPTSSAAALCDRPSWSECVLTCGHMGGSGAVAFSLPNYLAL